MAPITGLPDSLMSRVLVADSLRSNVLVTGARSPPPTRFLNLDSFSQFPLPPFSSAGLYIRACSAPAFYSIHRVLCFCLSFLAPRLEA